MSERAIIGPDGLVEERVEVLGGPLGPTMRVEYLRFWRTSAGHVRDLFAQRKRQHELAASVRVVEVAAMLGGLSIADQAWRAVDVAHSEHASFAQQEIVTRVRLWFDGSGL